MNRQLLDDLERLAVAACPKCKRKARWFSCGYHDDQTVGVYMVGWDAEYGPADIFEDPSRETAELTALLDPDTVLKLVAVARDAVRNDDNARSVLMAIDGSVGSVDPVYSLGVTAMTLSNENKHLRGLLSLIIDAVGGMLDVDYPKSYDPVQLQHLVNQVREVLK